MAFPQICIFLAIKVGKYLAFLGLISPEKRVDRASEIATRAGMDLKIAAKVDRPTRNISKRDVPLLKNPRVEYIGEINHREKNELSERRLRYLFPIDWPEPSASA